MTVKLELLEKEFKGCKVYTYTPDKERIAAALKALSEEMREDEELFNYVCSLTEFYYGSDALVMLGAYAEESTIVSETGVTEAETWKERQAALADYIAEHADEFAQHLVDSVFVHHIRKALYGTADMLCNCNGRIIGGFDQKCMERLV